MPKYTIYMPLYQAFSEFTSRCLLDNKSLLWADQRAWTAENVKEVKLRFVDNPMFGSDRSFAQKLVEQMNGAAPELWMILADIYFIYFLPSSFMTFEGKLSAIRWVAEQGNLQLPPITTDIWKALKLGFARTGQRYHLKYPQFLLLILFANQLKQMETPSSILADSAKLQQFLDDILESIPAKFDRGGDMRNGILYLAFPDRYEPMISNLDKDRIIKTYGSRVSHIPADTDKAIRAIREVLSANLDHDGERFSFYGSIKTEWKPSNTTDPKEIAPIEDDQAEVEEKRKLIFISYRRDDTADTTGRIYDWLVRNFSEEQIFKDVDSIPLGVNFKDHLTQNVSRCSALLAVIGDKWLTVTDEYGLRRIDDPKDFVRIEIEAALNRRIPVIPVFVQNAKASQEGALPYSLSELAWRQGINIQRDPYFKSGVESLIRALKELLA